MKRRKKVLVAIPTIGLVNSDSMHSLIELCVDIVRMEKEYEFMLGVFPRMLVAQAREAAVDTALKAKCDYILFVDDDMMLPRGLFKRLLSHKKDIVGSMSFERMGDHYPNIYMLHHYRKGKNEEGIETASMRWANILDYKDRRDKKGLLQVDVIGFGCVLINTRVFKGKNAIEGPYFMSQFQVGEDFFFCWKAKKAGFEVWADTSWQVGHLGDQQLITEEVFEFKQNMIKNGKMKSAGERWPEKNEG